ncbi:MAG: PIG-L family deacetylase [Nanoarchaeota archaeon]|nr:PIG-L family deacetylase [Nanoarchaeota archaeon]MBU1623160.1 PIG-L family deacetylase [Nanoarchaeota archaeon]
MESTIYQPHSKKRIMAILAHPDDEAIACGGLLAKTVNNGGEGFVYILTSNDERRSELEKSCQVFGVDYKALELSEKEFGFSSFSKEFLLGIEKIIADFRPHILVTHDQQYDYHADHRKTAELIMPRLQSVAMGSQGKPWIVELVLAAEINNLFPQPDILVDITEVYEVKQKALQQHSSQVKCDIKEDYYTGLMEFKALLRGHQMGTKYAEAFMTIRQPLVGNFYPHSRGPFL